MLFVLHLPFLTYRHNVGPVEHALAKTTIFTGFLSTMLLTFLSFSLFLMQLPSRAIVVKCDSNMYDVDVELATIVKIDRPRI